MDDNSNIYLAEQLRSTFEVIDSCLGCYYAKQAHMYKPLAAQLRILLCDTQKKSNNSLLFRLYPELQLASLQPISWSKKAVHPVRLYQQKNGATNIAAMPFKLTQYVNGLAVADFYHSSKVMLNIPCWLEQRVTHEPTTLTAKEIIRHIADKDGGAHVDKKPSIELRLLKKLTPVERPFGEMFIIALARMVQKIGEELLGYDGVRVSAELLNQQATEYSSHLLAHDDWLDF